VILEPINDTECLDQLTRIAREMVPTTLIQAVARRLGSRDAIIEWFQSLPQEDDRGSEQVRFIQCDVPQRARLLPDNPNCVERATGAMMLLEVIEPSTPRALATVDRPLRHTGLVERHGTRWYAVDLFPRRNARNFDWGGLGKDVLQGAHQYVGKPLMTSYGLGGVADTLGNQEDKAIGREKKKSDEKKNEPSSQGKRAEQSQPSSAARPRSPASGARFPGTGAPREQPTPKGGGGKDGEETNRGRPVAPSGAGGDGAPAAVEGDRGHPHDAGEVEKRFWWLHG
jgi:hypothetical protein